MPGSNAWAGLAAFLSSAGASAGKITRQYQDDVQEEEDRKAAEEKRKKEDIIFNENRYDRTRGRLAKISGGVKIKNAMAALATPMDPEEAKAHLASEDPKVIEQASNAIQEVAAKAQAPLPKQSARWQENEIKRKILESLAGQESTNEDIGAHPRAKNGLQAYGKFGIVPELHIDKIGLDPKNAADIEKWKKSPELQRDTAERIVDENYKASNGDVKGTIRRHYGLTSDPDKKQYLADGREMPSSNEYVEQAYSRFKGLGGTDGAGRGSVEKTAGNARAAIDNLINTKFEAPKKDRGTLDDGALGRLYATMSPDEIEQNKDYLDRITGLAADGRADYLQELSTYQNDLNRQTTAAMNAMKLDEQTQVALAKIKSGVKSLTPEEVRALESRRKLLESLRSQITDFTARVGSAKGSNREALLKTRPDLVGEEEPSAFRRIAGHIPGVSAAKGKPIIDDAKIQKKLDLIDQWTMETDRALAGLGGLERPSSDEIESDESTMLSRPGGKSPLSNYLTPVNK